MPCLSSSSFEFLVFARRGAAGDVVAEPLVFEGHARTDERRGESQRHVSAAEYGVVDLFARRIQHCGVGVAVLGRAVGLHGLHAAVEDVVEPGDEIFAGQIVGVEDRDGFGGFGPQLFDREIQRLALELFSKETSSTRIGSVRSSASVSGLSRSAMTTTSCSCAGYSCRRAACAVRTITASLL